MKALLQDIRNCSLCKHNLPLGPRPVLTATQNSKIVVIGQAPGTKVHASGKPWDDQSGKKLRAWLGVDENTFYNPDNFAIIPMGFCYPGKGKTGDLPPRPECAPKWHNVLMSQLTHVELILLIGTYAQKYYLPNDKRNLTEKTLHFETYLPKFMVMPHPSPTNRFWRAKNPWFETDVVPILQQRISKLLQ